MTLIHLNGPAGRLACRHSPGNGPGIIWFGGYRSDMAGTKASALAHWAKAEGRAFLRFDYSGHGASAGDPDAGTISAWLRDACTVVDALGDSLAAGPKILVGSSMGAWIATLVAMARPALGKAFVFIAPAPDFTEALVWSRLSPAQRETLMTQGSVCKDPDTGSANVYTRALIEDGRTHLVLGGAIGITGPVRILQGLADTAVPWSHAMAFADRLESRDLTVTLVKDGDHRLSRESDMRLMFALIRDVSG